MTTVLQDAGALALLSTAELRDCLRHAEVQLRQAYSRVLEVIAEADHRSMAQEAGFRDSAALLSRILQIPSGEARERVEHAAVLTARRTPTGTPLPVQLPTAAAALRAGELGTGHLRVITTMLGQLGPQVSAAQWPVPARTPSRKPPQRHWRPSTPRWPQASVATFGFAELMAARGPLGTLTNEHGPAIALSRTSWLESGRMTFEHSSA